MKLKTCEFCGEEFIPKSNRQKYCNREHWRSCPSCGKIYIEKFPENLSKPARLCRPTCRVEHKDVLLPEFEILETIGNKVIVDSTHIRNKYDNFNISKSLQERGFQCVHLFPDESIDRLISWCDETQVYDSSEFKVYKLNHDYVVEFLEQNDIAKHRKSTSISLGLVKGYEIFQVLSFSSPRYNRSYKYEISNICTKLHVKIAGGLDLLSSSASVHFGIDSCIVYQDLSKQFSSEMFENIGMKFHHFNPPHTLSSSVYNCGTSILVF